MVGICFHGLGNRESDFRMSEENNEDDYSDDNSPESRHIIATLAPIGAVANGLMFMMNVASGSKLLALTTGFATLAFTAAAVLARDSGEDLDREYNQLDHTRRKSTYLAIRDNTEGSPSLDT